MRDEGIAIGKAESVLQLLAEHESVSEELEQVILAERDINTLNSWLKPAAKTENAGELRKKAGLKKQRITAEKTGPEMSGRIAAAFPAGVSFRVPFNF